MLSFPNATKRKTLFRVLNSGKKFSSAGSLKLMNKESVFHSRPIRRICRENSIFEYRGKVKLNISTFYKIQKLFFNFESISKLITKFFRLSKNICTGRKRNRTKFCTQICLCRQTSNTENSGLNVSFLGGCRFCCPSCERENTD